MILIMLLIANPYVINAINFKNKQIPKNVIIYNLTLKMYKYSSFKNEHAERKLYIHIGTYLIC